MLSTEPAVLAEFELSGGALLVFCSGIVFLFADRATQSYDVSHIT